MADQKHPNEDSAAPSDTSDTSKTAKDHTGSGQEAARGGLPHGHDTEHQSNYGGGGTNGGSDRT